MTGYEIPLDGDASSFRHRVFIALLHEAETVSEKALARLRRLRDRFPSAVSTPLLEQLERIRSDPDAERRGAVRLDGGDRVEVLAGRTDGPPASAPVIDRSAGGLAVRLGRYVPPGEVVRIRSPGSGGAWFLAEVRYCRPDGHGWAVGCEFLGERPPA